MARKVPFRARNQFRRWLIHLLNLPVTASYAEIQRALEALLERLP